MGGPSRAWMGVIRWWSLPITTWSFHHITFTVIWSFQMYDKCHGPRVGARGFFRTGPTSVNVLSIGTGLSTCVRGWSSSCCRPWGSCRSVCTGPTVGTSPGPCTHTHTPRSQLCVERELIILLSWLYLFGLTTNILKSWQKHATGFITVGQYRTTTKLLPTSLCTLEADMLTIAPHVKYAEQSLTALWTHQHYLATSYKQASITSNY